jgi:cAMP phosphodiesterase
MIAVAEDPFAIQLLIKSAEQILIGVAKRTNRNLIWNWAEIVKPAFKKTFINSDRKTTNYLKHADQDHMDKLVIGDIAEDNIVDIAICAMNYSALFDHMTDHMRMICHIARYVWPDFFVGPDSRAVFDIAVSKVKNTTLADYLVRLRNDDQIKATLPHFEAEKSNDLQDTLVLYATRMADLARDE